MMHDVLRGRRGVRRERGAAAVEFALLAPILIMLIFAIISYGYMLSFRQALSQAAAEGARAAAVQPVGVTDLLRTDAAVKAVSDAVRSYGVRCEGGQIYRGATSAANDVGDCSITPPAACSTSVANATCVKVTLTYNYRAHPLLPSIGLGFTLPERLTYTSEVRVS